MFSSFSATGEQVAALLEFMMEETTDRLCSDTEELFDSTFLEQ